jgi:hypothetical protein
MNATIGKRAFVAVWKSEGPVGEAPGRGMGGADAAEAAIHSPASAMKPLDMG